MASDNEDRAFIFGGCGVEGRLNDLYKYSIKNNTFR
jgi:hypothetical protein